MCVCGQLWWLLLRIYDYVSQCVCVCECVYVCVVYLCVCLGLCDCVPPEWGCLLYTGVCLVAAPPGQLESPFQVVALLGLPSWGRLASFPAE